MLELTQAHVEWQVLALAVRFLLQYSFNLYMEVVFSSETMINCYQLARRYISRRQQSSKPENL